MESDEVDNLGGGNASFDEHQALNSTILEYYKKFGRKRDLEQYFSLSTAQGEIRDPSGLFWRRMKAQHDSSDSGEKSRESSLEVCRISIKCSVPDTEPSSSQDEHPKNKSDTESPPIIVEEPPSSQHSDNESIKSDDNNSQKSLDAIDTSINKAHSPSSSITSQRKLEWDSLADVGYANESDKRTSASSLSTLERLALKQQYSNSDTKEEVMGVPTAHSTPIDEDDPKAKSRKGSKLTKIYRKDVDFLEVNVPQGSANPSQSINVNLTKHISFNLEKNGAVSVDNVKKDISVHPEKVNVETDMTLQEKMDKEIQTSLVKTKEKSCSSAETPKNMPMYAQGIPVLINLNTLKKRHRKRKVTVRKKIRVKPKTDANKENLPVFEKSGDPVSEAESFEYMPGHIYNQNQLNKDIDKPNTSRNSTNPSGNKSSLESSGPTTDSSKGSKHSFTKDLEKSIKLLRDKLNKRYNDTELKEKLVKEVVQRLLKSSYRDDDPSTDFLSGLSFSSKKLDLGGGNNTTTSTSDANNTSEKMPRPRKSILRMDKFNANAIASTSQSAPNLPSVSNSEKPVSSKLTKVLTSSNTESDVSSKEKTSSDTAFAKTSSEELYQKYLEALRREENYKRHLREKEVFLKQKLVASDTAFNILPRVDAKSQIRLKELMKDLTRNNYDDGSGDASKLEGGPISNFDARYRAGRNQRSHSVFTLSSSPNSEQNRRSNLKKSDVNDAKAGNGNNYCCCSHTYSNKIGVSDSSVQVNFKNDDERASLNDVGTCCRPRNAKNIVRPSTARAATDYKGDMRPMCMCNKKVEIRDANIDEVHKSARPKNQVNESCGCSFKKSEITKKPELKLRDGDDDSDMAKISRCSQTNLKLDYSSHTHDDKEKVCLHEAIRCIQTDISINPKISEPTVTDIKFVKNCDCVKLIREQFRQVSKSSINSETNTQTKQTEGEDDDVVAISSEGSETRNKRKTTYRVDAEVQSDAEKTKSNNEKIEGNFTIPIQGTNMTLKVSVGSANPPVVRMDNSASTEQVQTVEGATSVSEECSKAVQSRDAMFSKLGVRPTNTIYHREAQSGAQTHPPVEPPRPFVRADTHTGIMDRGCDVQNDLLDQFFAKQPDNSSDERQYRRSGQYVESDTYPQYVEPRGDRFKRDQIQSRQFVESNTNPQYVESMDVTTKREETYTDARIPTDARILLPDPRMAPNRTFVPIQNPQMPYQSAPGVVMERKRYESIEPRIDRRSADAASCRQSEPYGNVNPERSNFVQNTVYATVIPHDQGCVYAPKPTTQPGNMYVPNSMSSKQPTFEAGLELPAGPHSPRYLSEQDGNYDENAARRSSASRPPDEDCVYAPGPITQSGNTYVSNPNSKSMKQPTFGSGPVGPPSPRHLFGRMQDKNFVENANLRSSPCPCPLPSGCGNLCADDARCKKSDPYDNVNTERNDFVKNTAYTTFKPHDEGFVYTQDQATQPGNAQIQNSMYLKPQIYGPSTELPAGQASARYLADQGGNAVSQSSGHPLQQQFGTHYSQIPQPSSSNPYSQQPTHTLGGYANAYQVERNDHNSASNPNYVPTYARKTDGSGFELQEEESTNYAAGPYRTRDPDSGYENIENRQVDTESTDEKIVETIGSGGYGKIRKQSSADKGLQTESNLTEESQEKYEMRRVQRSSPSPGATDLEDEIQEETLDKESEYQQEETVYRTHIDPSNLPHTEPQYRMESVKNKYEKRTNMTNFEEPGKKPGYKSGSWDNQRDKKIVSYQEGTSSKQAQSLPGSPRKKTILAQSKSYKHESPRIGITSRPPTAQMSKYHQHCAPKERNYLESPRSISPSRASSRSRSPVSYRGQSPREYSRSPSPTRNDQGLRSPRGTSPRKAKAPSNQILQASLRPQVKQTGRSKFPTSSTETDNDPRLSKAGASGIKNTQELPENASSKALITNVIQDIITRYTKKDIQQTQRKKCFKEIISILNYLLETEEGDDVNKHLNLVITDSSESSEKELRLKNKVSSETSPYTDKDNATKTYKKEIVTKKLRSVGSGTTEFERVKVEVSHSTTGKKLVDKGVQQSENISKARNATESSDLPVSTDLPGTSTDSATCRVLNRIRRECEKYHQKRCKGHGGKKCECSSTSESCEQCHRIPVCSCRPHKCKGHKSRGYCEKVKKKCVAYNLIIQTSDSMISEEAACDNNCRPLKNIIVKVPPKRKQAIETVPHKEVIEPRVPFSSPRYEGRTQRSRSLPNENYLSSNDEARTQQNIFTVRDYLERNRPDFIEQYTKRQNCLKMISESRSPDPCDPCIPCPPSSPCAPRLKSIVIHSPNVTGCPPVYCGGVRMSCDPCAPNAQSEVTTIANERSAQRKLLSQVQMDNAPLTNLSASDLRRLAKELGLNLRSRKVSSKLMSEREMKKHSERIYKTLPEVTRKKEELKKENIKKTNLLMANLFKKSLQKKTLRGTVNLSNYNKVIKI